MITFKIVMRSWGLLWMVMLSLIMIKTKFNHLHYLLILKENKL
jgi:hypothetical protein